MSTPPLDTDIAEFAREFQPFLPELQEDPYPYFTALRAGLPGRA